MSSKESDFITTEKQIKANETLTQLVNNINDDIKLDKGESQSISKKDSFSNKSAKEFPSKTEELKRSEYWNRPMLNQYRYMTIKKFLAFNQKEYIETLNFSQLEGLIPVKEFILPVLSWVPHTNFSLIDNPIHNINRIQSKLIKVLTNFNLKSVLKLQDRLDSMNIEYNHPIARDRIRTLNRLHLNDMHVTSSEINWPEKVNELLEKFFPMQNHIWAHVKDDSYVSVQELALTVLEYGLFDSDDKKLVNSLVENVHKSSLSLRKLEDSWRDKYNAIMAKPDADYDDRENITAKITIVAKYLANAKEYLAKISIQIMTLYYDDIFKRLYEQIVSKKLKALVIDKTVSESETAAIEEMIENNFPFYNSKFYNEMLHVVMNYLSEYSKIGEIKIRSTASKKATEKAFMYTTTIERDCFIQSIQSVTNSDYRFFDVQIDKKDPESKFFANVRDEFMDIIDALTQGFIDKTGNLRQGSKFLLFNNRPITKRSNKTDKISNTVKPIEESHLLPNKESQRSTGAEYLVVASDIQINMQSSSKPLTSIIKTLCDRVFEQCKSIAVEREEGEDDDTDEGKKPDEIPKKGKIIACRYGIPILLLALADYLYGYMDFEYCGFLHKDIFGQLGSLSNNANLCKAQIFKGDGWFHFMNLVQRNCSQAIIFLDKLTDEKNIGSYVSKNVFDSLVSYFKSNVKRVSQESDSNEDSSFDFIPYFNLMLMNRFWDKLFKKPAFNEREAIKNMTVLQQSVYIHLAEKFIPKAIALLEDPDMESNYELMFDNENFKIGEEEKLCFVVYSESKNNLNKYKIQQMKLFAYISNLRVMNRASKSCYSRKVLQKMTGPINQFAQHVINSDLGRPVKFKPPGYFGEVLKQIRFYIVNPEANWLIDRETEFKRIDPNADLVTPDLITKLFEKCEDFNQHYEGEEDIVYLKRARSGKPYLLGGLLPLQYKYITGFKNLTNYRDVNDIEISAVRMTSLINQFNKYKNALSVISNIPAEIFEGDELQAKLEKFTEISKADVKDKFEMAIHLEEICGELETMIINSFTGKTNSGFKFAIEQYFPVKKATFQEKKNRPKVQSINETDPAILMKREVISTIISKFKKVKTDFTTKDNNTTLIGFYRRNQDNLRGVFESTIESLFEKNVNNMSEEEQKECISENPVVANFWQNTATQYYLQFQGTLLVAGLFVRKTFLNFIHELADGTYADKVEKINMKITPTYENGQLNKAAKVYHGVKKGKEDSKVDTTMEAEKANNINKKKKIIIPFMDFTRRKIFDVLMKLISDMLFFQLSKPTVNDIWWNLNEIFSHNITFIKNIAEGNFLDFKLFIGTYRFSSEQDVTFNKDKLTMSEFFTSQMLYILNWSLLCENQNPMLVSTDQHERILATLKPILGLMTEITTGPCKLNQQIILSVKYIPVYGIIFRKINDLCSDIQEIKLEMLNFQLALCEGYEKKILLRLAGRCQVFLFEEFLITHIKKLFIREKIKTGEVLEKIKETQYPPEAFGFVKRGDVYWERQCEMEETAEIKEIINKGKPQVGAVKTLGLNDFESKFSTGEKEDSIWDQQTMKTSNLESQGTMFGEKRLTNDGIDCDIIKCKAEDFIEIQDWEEDLLNYYKTSEDFSGSRPKSRYHMKGKPMFALIFKMYTLWKILAIESKAHKYRLQEIETQANEYHGEYDTDYKMDGVIRTKNTKKDSIFPIFYFIRNIRCNVEVVSNGEPLVIYFPRYPACFFLSDLVKRDYRNECEILDSSNKMKELMSNYVVFEKEMNILLYWYKKNRMVYHIITEEFFNYYLKVLFFIGFSLNVFLGWAITSITITNSDESKTTNWEWDNSWKQHSIAVFLAFVQIGLGGTGIALYFIRYQKALQKAKIRFRLDNPKDDSESFYNKIKIRVWDAFLANDFVFSASLHVVLCMLGQFFKEVFLTMQLINIIWISKTSHHVITSVTKNFNQLVMTQILCIFFIYIFATLMVQNYASHISEDFEAIGCKRLADCAIDLFNQGFRQGGGVGDIMNFVSINHKDYWGIFIYQMLFFLLINIIFLNIIFGVIIDTFAELREAASAREDDEEHICYVCGLSRKDFSAESKDFEHHLEYEHNPWDYIYFMYYVEKQGSFNLNGLEQFSQDNYLLIKTEWLPIQNTGYLKQEGDTLLEDMKEDVTQIKKWLKNYDSELTRNNKERKLIGLKKQEIHKQIVPKINENLSRGVITDKSQYKKEQVVKFAETTETGAQMIEDLSKL